MKPNNMYFSKEQVEAGEMSEFINVLLKQCYGASKYYNDIHIRPDDCGAFIVEWVNVPWDHEFGGSYQYIEEDQVVMIEKQFPDGHYDLCYDEEDYNEKLNDWLKANPGWVMTSYGTWTNEIENKKFQEDCEKARTIIEEAPLYRDEEEITGSSISQDHFENGIPQ